MMMVGVVIVGDDRVLLLTVVLLCIVDWFHCCCYWLWWRWCDIIGMLCGDVVIDYVWYCMCYYCYYYWWLLLTIEIWWYCIVMCVIDCGYDDVTYYLELIGIGIKYSLIRYCLWYWMSNYIYCMRLTNCLVIIVNVCKYD